MREKGLTDATRVPNQNKTLCLTYSSTATKNVSLPSVAAWDCRCVCLDSSSFQSRADVINVHDLLTILSP
jgi:hypothetical protein